MFIFPGLEGDSELVWVVAYSSFLLNPNYFNYSKTAGSTIAISLTRLKELPQIKSTLGMDSGWFMD